MAAKLSINLNKVAMLRNQRDLPWPDPVHFGRIGLAAGAHGLTVHPRPDERHIRRSDVPTLAALIRAEFPDREFNIEGYPTEDFLALCEAARPDQVTLVPDEPGQKTSDHGWDCVRHGALLRSVIGRLKAGGMRVSVFLDADPVAVPAALATGTDRIELYTGPYGGCFADPARAAAELARLGATADAAGAAGLGVNAGHDLTIANLPALVARVPALLEVSIGHCFTADALELGFAGATRAYLAACGQG